MFSQIRLKAISILDMSLFLCNMMFLIILLLYNNKNNDLLVVIRPSL
jgi:hypothetical protein